MAALLGLFIFAGAVWWLSRSLGDHEPRYAGKTLDDWRQQLESRDTGSSNQAYLALNNQIIPRLVEQMLHDTNDSKFRLSLIDDVDRLPGVQINFTKAPGRRLLAVGCLGSLGPPAAAAVPFLIQTLKGPEDRLCEPAIQALGQIHSNPDEVIPLLITYLADDDLDDAAATALGNYGSVAREAFPKIVPLLKARNSATRAAARAALKEIDPDAAAKADVE